MEFRHLRYIIAVAEEGHITRAAERLGIQQPPLSRQIKAIEQEIDAQLFRRTPRGVELTDAGRAFVDNARAVLAHVDQTLETTRRTARGEQGRISVGYTTGAAFHPVVPRILFAFKESFPLVSLTLVEGFPDDLVERIRKDQIDAVFTRTAVGNMERIFAEPLLRETVVVALSRRHRFARSERGRDRALSLKALANEPFILVGRPDMALPTQSNAEIVACQEAGFSPRIAHLVSNNISRLALVAAGQGVALMSASMQRMNIEGVAFRRLKGLAHLKMPLLLASRRGDTSAVVRQFLKLAKQTARDFGPEQGSTTMATGQLKAGKVTG